MVVLDNKKNRFCGSAAMIGFPEAEVLVIIGFQASELPFQYQQVMDRLRQAFQSNYILESRELDLDYKPPRYKPHMNVNFNDQHLNEWAVTIDGQMLPGL